MPAAAASRPAAALLPPCEQRASSEWADWARFCAAAMHRRLRRLASGGQMDPAAQEQYLDQRAEQYMEKGESPMQLRMAGTLLEEVQAKHNDIVRLEKDIAEVSPSRTRPNAQPRRATSDERPAPLSPVCGLRPLPPPPGSTSGAAGRFRPEAFLVLRRPGAGPRDVQRPSDSDLAAGGHTRRRRAPRGEELRPRAERHEGAQEGERLCGARTTDVMATDTGPA